MPKYKKDAWRNESNLIEREKRKAGTASRRYRKRGKHLREARERGGWEGKKVCAVEAESLRFQRFQRSFSEMPKYKKDRSRDPAAIPIMHRVCQPNGR
jgi:hypothetical protein